MLCRFNELRKVRSKPKAAGTERPFSRMYNFFVLEQGDKWAKTGTRFKPRSAAGYPRPETVTASDMKKERSVSKSPAQGPVQVPTRAPEPKRAQQAQPQAKTTTHAIRPVSAGRNAQILGNRPSPPPPTPERARPAATTRALDEDDAMQCHGRSRQQGELQLHQQQLQLLGKRRREYDERLGAPQPGQAQPVRRLRTVDAGAQERYGYASAWHTSPSVRWRYNNAAMLGEEERGYLHRMRPEVREEVLSPMLHGMHKPSSRFAASNGLLSWPGEAAGQGTGGWAQTVDAADAMHDRDMTHGRGAEYAYSSMPTAGVYMHAPGFRERAEPHDDADEDEDEHVPAKPGAFSDKMNQARLREVSGVASGEAVEDGFSACWATPDTVVAIDEEFVGSPLDLGDSECGLSVLLPDSPLTSPAVSASKKCGDGLVFDAMEDAAWGIADFSGGPW